MPTEDNHVARLEDTKPIIFPDLRPLDVLINPNFIADNDLEGKKFYVGLDELPSDGTSDHAKLTNLDYASSGHTGFVSIAELDALNTNINTRLPLTGGTITGNIDVEGGVVRLHETLPSNANDNRAVPSSWVRSRLSEMEETLNFAIPQTTVTNMPIADGRPVTNPVLLTFPVNINEPSTTQIFRLTRTNFTQSFYRMQFDLQGTLRPGVKKTIILDYSAIWRNNIFTPFNNHNSSNRRTYIAGCWITENGVDHGTNINNRWHGHEDVIPLIATSAWPTMSHIVQDALSGPRIDTRAVVAHSNRQLHNRGVFRTLWHDSFMQRNNGGSDSSAFRHMKVEFEYHNDNYKYVTITGYRAAAGFSNQT